MSQQQVNNREVQPHSGVGIWRASWGHSVARDEWGHVWWCDVTNLNSEMTMQISHDTWQWGAHARGRWCCWQTTLWSDVGLGRPLGGEGELVEKVGLQWAPLKHCCTSNELKLPSAAGLHHCIPVHCASAQLHSGEWKRLDLVGMRVAKTCYSVHHMFSSCLCEYSMWKWTSRICETGTMLCHILSLSQKLCDSNCQLRG